ncbi:hypothetical protein NON20_24295 (plasmid) [Synechocystis sp. B12]|nr:hypothetical protein NON20_24295 [Synechocystis sp. B12]
MLDLQDFSGARELTSDTAFSNAQYIRKELNKLDKLISFNLTEIKHDLSLDEQIIERIAIALWSEKGYRQRGKWMSWITTMAGAFELACNHYLTTQDDWFWQEKEITVSLGNELISKDKHFFIPIGKLVESLLTSGEFSYKDNDKEIRLKCRKISHPKWLSFVYFYCNKGWKVSNKHSLSFSHVRNDLYHSLMGDKLDSILDSKTELYPDGVFNKDHPGQVAVQQLRSLLEITNLWETVNEKVKKYQFAVRSIKEALLK